MGICVCIELKLTKRLRRSELFVCANAELKDGGGGFCRLFPPQKLYRYARERVGISCGEGKWIPLQKIGLNFENNEQHKYAPL
jgi:hypothetical protein